MKTKRVQRHKGTTCPGNLRVLLICNTAADANGLIPSYFFKNSIYFQVDTLNKVIKMTY